MPLANNSTIQKGKKSASVSTQIYLPIAEFYDDFVVLKDGGLRAILKTSSINFNLKSEEEQNAIIYSYQGFLNTIEFPIQIVLRSKKLDIEKYLVGVRQAAVKQPNSLLQRQTYEYAEYIHKLVEYADIMEKNFFVIVPYDPFRSENSGILKSFLKRIHPADSVIKSKQRIQEFETLKKGIVQRVNIVRSGLENCGLRAAQLKTKELIEFFYNIYNPETAANQKLEDVDKMNLVA